MRSLRIDRGGEGLPEPGRLCGGRLDDEGFLVVTEQAGSGLPPTEGPGKPPRLIVAGQSTRRRSPSTLARRTVLSQLFIRWPANTHVSNEGGAACLNVGNQSGPGPRDQGAQGNSFEPVSAPWRRSDRRSNDGQTIKRLIAVSSDQALDLQLHGRGGGI